ncbi:hypothetical protein FB45DRAFT_1036933 [Roridomyces roridus]|uniref:Uncharacterized protein n=1 Tax=Roridomyces roridus TaxID=1738132 RepID=A0AAD7B878_9AGAR|nr:hypothetical protein FB45DRAFT_1036933 [Roridomyces roridus]
MHRCLEVPELPQSQAWGPGGPGEDIDSLFDGFVVHEAQERYYWQAKYSTKLLRPLQGSDFERVFVHAARVKCLFSDPNAADLPSVLHAARPWLSEDGVFPMLQSLYWMYQA